MAKKIKEKEVKELVEEKNVKTNKVLKELDKQLEEKQKLFLENLDEKINKQIEINVTKRMKEEEKRINRGKFWKIIRRDIFILILLGVIGYFGYCLYKVDYFHIRTKVVEVEKEPIKNVDNNPSNNDPTVPEQINRDSAYLIKNYGYLVDKLQIDDSSILTFYSKSVTNEKLSNDIKLKIAYKNLEDNEKTIENNMIQFKASDLLVSAKEIFGSNSKLDNTLFTYNNTKFMFYNDIFLGYKEANMKVNVLYQVIEGKEENDDIIFDIVVAKKDGKKLVTLKDKVIIEDYKEESLDKYKDKLSHVEITFQKDGDHYYFSKLETK